jgi:hypothetical protein
MTDERPQSSTEGWMFRVIDPNYPDPRYFVAGHSVEDQALLLVEDHPDVQGDRIEVVGPLSVSSTTFLELRPGDVRRIDAP